jgi:NADH:ubiquinone oxidoreductase subunit F (NADH-binding)
MIVLTGLQAGRLLADVPVGLAEHRRQHGLLPAGRRDDAVLLLQRLAGAGLRGRGGAGFPTDRKLSTASAAGRGGQLVVNAAEGEPASLKDQALLGCQPHLVLDGAQLAARSFRAREVVVAVHEGGVAEEVIRCALAERAREDRVRARLLRVPNRYVSGEGSALARAAQGGPALPALHDLPLAARGPAGPPTVVLNVETLAGLALHLEKGPEWYGRVGTPDEPGTVLLTVRSDDTSPTVLEVPLGTELEQALVLSGADPGAAQAVLVGGYFGAWLSATVALRTPLSRAGLAGVGGTLGAGLVMALSKNRCGLRATAQAVRYLADQSARQCGPCRNGLPALATAMELLAEGTPPSEVLDRLRQVCGLVEGRGLCHQPDGAVTLVRSALAVFADDVQDHLEGRCHRPAGTALAVPR